MTPSELRADARKNRDHIIDVARKAFAGAPDTSLNAIAKAAGVGPGTLYRHFPSREALVIAVYHKEISEMVDLAPQLIAAHPPLVALKLWFERMAHYGRVKHGVSDVLHAAMKADESIVRESYGPMVGAIAQLLAAGVATGDIRPGVDAEDVLLMVGFLSRMEPTAAGIARGERLLDLVIEGLRNR